MQSAPTSSRPYKRNADGLWVIAINLGTGADGTRKRVTVARKRRSDAINTARTRLREIEDGLITTAGTATVESWLTYWLEHILPPRALSPNTIRNYRGQVTNSIVPAIGKLRLTKLTPAHIRELHTGIATRGLSVATSKLVHVILQKALDDAVKEGMLTKNPATHVGRPKGDTDLRPALTADQARHLIDTSIRAGDPMAYRFAAALLTGARQGEIIGLTWDRVDFTRGVLDLSWALVAVGQLHGCGDTKDGTPHCGAPRNRPRDCPDVHPNTPRGYRHIPLTGPLVLGQPKTKSSTRLIPLIGPMATALREHRAAHPPGEFDLVWTNPTTGTPLSPVSDHRNWHRALERAGLPRMPLHSARHTAATIMQTMKVEESVRMQLLGHNSQAVHRNYAHVDQELTRAALAGYGDTLGIGA